MSDHPRQGGSTNNPPGPGSNPVPQPLPPSNDPLKVQTMDKNA